MVELIWSSSSACAMPAQFVVEDFIRADTLIMYSDNAASNVTSSAMKLRYNASDSSSLSLSMRSSSQPVYTHSNDQYD